MRGSNKPNLPNLVKFYNNGGLRFEWIEERGGVQDIVFQNNSRPIISKISGYYEWIDFTPMCKKTIEELPEEFHIALALYF
jgi:hypothetical protein